MARQSRSSRPAARPAAAPVPQTRSASTTAPYAGTAPHPPVSKAPPVPPQAQTKEPGMFAQMAATAGSVAVGSTIGHGISNMLFGGSSSTPTAPEAVAPPVQQQTYQAQQGPCAFELKEFTDCMERWGNNNVDACTFVLDRLKTCQATPTSR